jgi:hypothetical protein
LSQHTAAHRRAAITTLFRRLMTSLDDFDADFSAYRGRRHELVYSLISLVRSTRRGRSKVSHTIVMSFARMAGIRASRFIGLIFLTSFRARPLIPARTSPDAVRHYAFTSWRGRMLISRYWLLYDAIYDTIYWSLRHSAAQTLLRACTRPSRRASRLRMRYRRHAHSEPDNFDAAFTRITASISFISTMPSGSFPHFITISPYSLLHGRLCLVTRFCFSPRRFH